MPSKFNRLCVAAVASLFLAGPSVAATVTGFGPFGSVRPGTADGISFGSGTEVFQLDAYVRIDGSDLNGPAFGESAQLSLNALPSGLDLVFASMLLDNSSDLLLSYTLTNNTGSVISNLSFFSYVDAEIDEPINTFFNEFATVDGAAAPGQSFEIDEPGFQFGNLLANLQLGALDGTNAIGALLPDDVAMALGFTTGSLGLGDTTVISILLSEDGDRLGDLALIQQDMTSSDRLTFSGRAERRTTDAIPEPRAALLFGIGNLLLLMHRRITPRIRR